MFASNTVGREAGKEVNIEPYKYMGRWTIGPLAR